MYRALIGLACAASLGCHRGTAGDELVLWAMGSEGEAAARLMPGFTERHPGVRVRVQQIPWSAAHEKLLTAFVGDSMPDVFQAGNTWLPELVELEAIEPLDALLKSSQSVVLADCFPGIVDTNVIGGATYGVPWYVDTRVLFYRSDLVRDAGFTEAPRTWEEWFAAAERLPTRGRPGHFAMVLPLREWQVPVILALQRDGELLRDGERFGNFQSARVRAAFDQYSSFFRRGLAPASSESASGNVYQDFARGAFAFYVTGPWNLGEMARRLPPELQERWATTPLPSPGAGWPGASLAGGASLVVSRKTRRAGDAWRLVEYLAEPAQQAELYRLTGDLPSRRAAWETLGLASDRRARAFYLQLQTLKATPKIPEWEQIATKVAEHSESLARGEAALDDVLTRLDREVDTILEKRRWLLDAAKGSRSRDAG